MLIFLGDILHKLNSLIWEILVESNKNKAFLLQATVDTQGERIAFGLVSGQNINNSHPLKDLKSLTLMKYDKV